MGGGGCSKEGSGWGRLWLSLKKPGRGGGRAHGGQCPYSSPAPSSTHHPHPPSCTLTQRAVRSRGQGQRAGREERLGTHTRLCLPFCPQGGGQLPRPPRPPRPPLPAVLTRASGACNQQIVSLSFLMNKFPSMLVFSSSLGASADPESPKGSSARPGGGGQAAQ